MPKRGREVESAVSVEEVVGFEPHVGGVQFLMEHGLKVVSWKDFVTPDKKPYVTASDRIDFGLVYRQGSKLSTGCIIDHSRQTPRYCALMLIYLLGEYADKAAGMSELDVIDNLGEGEAMMVALASPGWERVLRLIDEQLYPGTVIWPE